MEKKHALTAVARFAFSPESLGHGIGNRHRDARAGRKAGGNRGREQHRVQFSLRMEKNHALTAVARFGAASVSERFAFNIESLGRDL